MGSEEIDGLTQQDRLVALDRCSHIQAGGSDRRVANLDSLNYILRFVYGSESNIGAVSGAFKTLGLNSDLAGTVARRIYDSVQAGHDQDTAFNEVLRDVGIRCERLREFPARSALSQDEQAAASEEFNARMRALGQAEQNVALQTQKLEREIAELLGVAITEIDGEWGWQRTDNGRRFSPSTDGGDAFDLISEFRLNVHHLPRDPVRGYTDVVVTHTDSQTGRPMIALHSSDFSYSLPRTLCEAAIRAWSAAR